MKNQTHKRLSVECLLDDVPVLEPSTADATYDPSLGYTTLPDGRALIEAASVEALVGTVRRTDLDTFATRDDVRKQQLIFRGLEQAVCTRTRSDVDTRAGAEGAFGDPRRRARRQVA